MRGGAPKRCPGILRMYLCNGIVANRALDDRHFLPAGACGKLSAAERKRTVNKHKIGILVIVLGVVLSSVGDVYQFIISGYPATNESYPAASSGTALVTATHTVPTVAAPLEARYRTWDESEGIALRSDKYHTTMIIFR